MKIKIFVTGGTFDKEYNELDGSLFFRETHVPEMLKLGRCNLEVDVHTLMLMDSLDIRPNDRENIALACENEALERIVITHGTDTMVETAVLLAERVKNKTIVLTGAMVPFKFGASDGLFNIGSAMAFAQALPAGVYITMNGELFEANNCRKNRELGKFERLS